LSEFCGDPGLKKIVAVIFIFVFLIGFICFIAIKDNKPLPSGSQAASVYDLSPVTAEIKTLTVPEKYNEIEKQFLQYEEYHKNMPPEQWEQVKDENPMKALRDFYEKHGGEKEQRGSIENSFAPAILDMLARTSVMECELEKAAEYYDVVIKSYDDSTFCLAARTQDVGWCYFETAGPYALISEAKIYCGSYCGKKPYGLDETSAYKKAVELSYKVLKDYPKRKRVWFQLPYEVAAANYIFVSCEKLGYNPVQIESEFREILNMVGDENIKARITEKLAERYAEKQRHNEAVSLYYEIIDKYPKAYYTSEEDYIFLAMKAVEKVYESGAPATKQNEESGGLADKLDRIYTEIRNNNKDNGSIYNGSAKNSYDYLNKLLSGAVEQDVEEIKYAVPVRPELITKAKEEFGKTINRFKIPGILEDGKKQEAGKIMGDLKSAISIYFGDHSGIWPETLQALIPEYIKEIPKDPFKKSDNVINLKGRFETAMIPDFITDEGGWIYSKDEGVIFYNIQGKDSKGKFYYFYGYE
jgi:tetratricopeptide (TPR) repeat protein